MVKRKKFGEILIEAGVINEETLQKALQRQRGTGKALGEILEVMGIVSQKDIAVALARQFGYRTVSGIARHPFSNDLLKLVPEAEALKQFIFPLKVEERTLYLAMVNPLDMATLDSIAFRTGLRIVPCVTTSVEIQEAIRTHYSPEGTPLSQEQMIPGGRCSVLVVDDHEIVRGAVAAAIRREGCDVLEAANGAEGLKIALQKIPHLIVTDILMPQMDGYQMFRGLQSNPSTRNIPVIAFSSKSTPEEEAKVLEMGFYDFVAKPINQIRLMARVRRVMKLVQEKQGQ